MSSTGNKLGRPLDYATPVRRRTWLLWTLCIGVAVLAVVFILAASSRPSLGRSRETANRVKCCQNLRQLGQAMTSYAQMNGGNYPVTLEEVLMHARLDANVLLCPSSNDELPPGETIEQRLGNLWLRGRPDDRLFGDLRRWCHVSYVYLAAGLTTANSAETVLICEPPRNHDFDGMCVLFGDGHVEFVSKRFAEKMIVELLAGCNPPRPEKLR